MHIYYIKVSQTEFVQGVYEFNEKIIINKIIKNVKLKQIILK